MRLPDWLRRDDESEPVDEPKPNEPDQDDEPEDEEDDPSVYPLW